MSIRWSLLSGVELRVSAHIYYGNSTSCVANTASLGYNELKFTGIVPNIVIWMSCYLFFTHWDRVMHICADKLTIIGSDNGLLPGRRRGITWTSAVILLIGRLGTNFSEMLIGIQTFSFKKMRWKISSGKWQPFCLGLDVLIPTCHDLPYYNAKTTEVHR